MTSQPGSLTPLYDPSLPSPFHPGELAVQERAGVLAFAWSAGQRSIRGFMPDQHREFFAELPMMVFAGLDATGQPWPSLRVGAPGFVSSPDQRTLQIAGSELPGDPLSGAWQVGGLLGGLGLMPQVRRRNRVNGVITALQGGVITLTVEQSFGNCPQYIQGRTPTWIDGFQPGSQVLRADRLSEADRTLLAAADTFFIASAQPDEQAGRGRGVDVSHRGGKPGFVRVDDDATLTVPDFTGNRFFNTLGNLLSQPRAGLLFIDYLSGDVLYIAVEAEIIWEAEQVAAFPGAERLLRLKVKQVRRTPAVLPFSWSATEFAAQFAAMEAAKPSVWRALEVVEVREDTPSIRSFTLRACDGRPLKRFEPGQYLPIQVPIAGAEPLIRTYSLSDAPSVNTWRISVKREGVASAWLHDHLKPGMHLQAKTPRGDFRFDSASPRPAVLISAGIGITPMMAVVNQCELRQPAVHFIHGARHSSERPFAAELTTAAARHAHLRVHLLDSTHDADSAPGTRHGRADIEQVKKLLGFDDYDFYLCGPPAFMRDLYQGLRGLNVADSRIHFEAFGPASVQRTPGAGAVESAGPIPVSVTFARSAKTAEWTPAKGTLLELAEANGIAVESGCRMGECGTCMTRIKSGQMGYQGEVDADVEAGCGLLCVGRPAGPEPLVLEL